MRAEEAIVSIQVSGLASTALNRLLLVMRGRSEGERDRPPRWMMRARGR